MTPSVAAALTLLALSVVALFAFSRRRRWPPPWKASAPVLPVDLTERRKAWRELYPKDGARLRGVAGRGA